MAVSTAMVTPPSSNHRSTVKAPPTVRLTVSMATQAINNPVATVQTKDKPSPTMARTRNPISNIPQRSNNLQVNLHQATIKVGLQHLIRLINKVTTVNTSMAHSLPNPVDILRMDSSIRSTTSRSPAVKSMHSARNSIIRMLRPTHMATTCRGLPDPILLREPHPVQTQIVA